MYVVVLELKQTNDVSKNTGEDNNELGLEPRLARVHIVTSYKIEVE